MKTYKQGSLVWPTKPFTAKIERSVIRAACGQSFWVVSPEYIQQRDGIVQIARSGQKTGWAFKLSDAYELFGEPALPKPQFPGCLDRENQP